MLMLAWLFACTGPGDTVDTDVGAWPTLAITAPTADSVVCGAPLQVTLAITDFRLVPPEDGSEPHPGEGHVDVFLNGQSAAMTPSENFVIDDVADGAWQLRADLASADHQALIPNVGDLVYFSTSTAACGTP